jgi:GNAT superfamily N-acetyltransferase
MSIETAAIQLNELLSGAGISLVATLDGEVLAYAEAYQGAEPNPFGEHVHLAHLVVHPDHAGHEPDAALVQELLNRAKEIKAKYLTVSQLAGAVDETFIDERYGLQPLAQLRRFSIPARTGQIFYRATEHLDPNPAQISGWHMPVGRLSSARHQWASLWPRIFETLPENRRQRTHRMQFSASGQEAFVLCKQHLYDPRSADLYCWSPKPLTGQLVSALRDWGHREGYRALVLVVAEDTIKVLGQEAEPDGFTQSVCAVTV